MHMIETGLTTAAVILLIVAGWSAIVLFSPYRKCRWCEVFAGLRMRCRRCNGSKMTRRLGAGHVHRVRLALRQAWDERGQ